MTASTDPCVLIHRLGDNCDRLEEVGEIPLESEGKTLYLDCRMRGGELEIVTGMDNG